MKKLAIFLILLVMIFAGVILYGLFQSNLQVVSKGLEVYFATDVPQLFDQHKTEVENKGFIGTLIRNEPLGYAEDYVYRRYSLRVKNNGLVDAEMVEIQIAPEDEDVLYYGENGKVDIKAGETKEIWCVLLSKKDTPDVRNFFLTYYLWGNPQEVKFTYDNTK